MVVNLDIPSMVSAKGLNELISAMPDSVKKLLVWKVRFKRNGFLAGEYYSLVYYHINNFCVTVATHLIARHVDKGRWHIY